MWHSRPRLWVQRLNALLVQTRRAEALPGFRYRATSAQNKEETPGEAPGVEGLVAFGGRAAIHGRERSIQRPLPLCRGQRAAKAERAQSFLC